MAPAGGKTGQDKGAGEVINDLWQLCRDYAKQEMVNPLLALKRLLAFGLPGALLLTVGIGFGALAVLRGFQTELGGTLDGNFDFVPYVASALATGVAIFALIRQIKRPFRSEETQR